jgi:UDP-N-acetylmuramoyl-L-alanyl-D-glutamate--2,6-diaminopimelate ligase
MQADMVSINKQFPQAFDQSVQPLLARFGIQAPDIMISELVLDSRDVAIHKAFIAIDGHALDGRDFIPQAISLGAKVIIAQCNDVEDHGRLEMRDQSVIIGFYQLSAKLSELAGYFYDFPANSMSVIAVTGTNGKTSTVQLTNQLVDLLGEQAASIGTLGAGMCCSNQDEQNLEIGLQTTANTTPDAISMQRLLAEFVGEGAAQVALEASSHALLQHRIAAIKTDVAVFTNLSRDHLDYHGSMANYAQAKRLLLGQPQLAYAVLNMNDPEHTNWLANLSPSTAAVLYGQDVDVATIPTQYQYCVANNVRYTVEGIGLSMQSSWGNCEIRLSLLGAFNVANVMAAIAGQLCLGKSLKKIAYIVQKLKPVAGRMELFKQNNQPTIVVDYAHTPDALEKALLASRQHCQGNLYCVFGCGGDRDVGKRSLMGEIAQRLADQVILTDDNARSEKPAAIIQDILSGCVNPEKILIENNRKKAITKAAALASHGDLILVAGKGHENYQITNQQTLAYDERQFVALFQQGKTL